MWRNDTEYKYMFMFPLKNLTRKDQLVDHYIGQISISYGFIRIWNMPQTRHSVFDLCDL